MKGFIFSLFDDLIIMVFVLIGIIIVFYNLFLYLGVFVEKYDSL